MKKKIYIAKKGDNGKCLLCKRSKDEITHRIPIDCLIMKIGERYEIKEEMFYSEISKIS